MAYTTQYIGSRYVPLFAEPAEWDSTRTYEPLTIVMHDGNSYTSRQYVPVGIEITNEKFWALTGNYNAQVEQYRQDVVRYSTQLNTVSAALNSEITRATTADNKLTEDLKKCIFSFDSIESLKSSDTDFKLNDYVQVQGLIYKITNDAANGMDIIGLDNGLSASLIIGDYVNVRAIGAEPSSTKDLAPYIMRLHTICVNRNRGMTIKIPAGHWYASPMQFTYAEGIKIIGENTLLPYHENEQYTTVISNYYTNQEYIFCIGLHEKNVATSVSQMCKNYLLENIHFVNTTVSQSVVILSKSEGCRMNYLSFSGIMNGNCLLINASWECHFGTMMFRQIASLMPCIRFEAVTDYTITNVPLNQSALYFDYLSFENLNPTAIQTDEKSWVADCQFNTIEAEWSAYGNATVYKSPVGNEIPTYIIAGYFINTSINQINIDTGATHYYNYNGVNYSKHAIITHDISDTPYTDAFYRHFTVSVGTINMRSNNHYVIASHNANTAMCLTIGNLMVQNYTPFDFYYGLCIRIGAFASCYNTRQNNLMNIPIPAQSIALSPLGAMLCTRDDATDITHCVLGFSSHSRFNTNGASTITIRAITVNKETQEPSATNIIITAFPASSGSSSGYKTIKNTNTELAEFVIDLSSMTTPNYFTLKPANEQEYDLYVYDIDFS